MIAQMVGAGSLVSLLIPQISFNNAIVLVGVLMLVYVIFGGMLATTWVQIIKAVLLMGGHHPAVDPGAGAVRLLHHRRSSTRSRR